MQGKPTVIKFFAPVIEETVQTLLSVIDDKMRHGATEFVLLISSPGGDAFYGLSAYNYLKGIPATITTHNFGTVDSIAIVLYCSGTRRLSVPQAQFLLHGVSVTFAEETTLEESQLEERLKEMRIDKENVAKVIAANTGKSVEEVASAMLTRTMLNPDDAQRWGLVHEIKSELFEVGAELVSIVCQDVVAEEGEEERRYQHDIRTRNIEHHRRRKTDGTGRTNH
ncbi:MAG: ClpP family protease [Candidatus Binatia bacterium]